MELVKPEDVGLSTAGLRRIDEHLSRRYVEPGKIAGALTLVARRGRVALLSPLGYRDRERKLPTHVDTLFRIHSMTKPITAVAAMMLFERGALQLADPVHRWLPEFENLRVYQYGSHPSFATERARRPMTVRDLLTHQSGLSYQIMDRTGLDAAYRKLGIGNGKGTLADMMQTLATLPLEFSPGDAWSYSVASDVVAHIVELVSGKRFDVFIREEILEPLGMVDTDFTVPETKRERFAACYARNAKKELVLFDDPMQSAHCRPMTFFGGGSGLVSTASDYLRFAEMLRRGGELDGVRLLGPRTVRFMTQNHLPGGKDLAAFARGSFSETPYEGIGFGLGVSVTIDPVRAQVPSSAGEYGWGGMASTAFWVDPAEELVVIFMTQLLPSTIYGFRTQLKQLVYSAIVD